MARRAWQAYRCHELQVGYRRRRDQYAREAAERRLSYREELTIREVGQRLKQRGYVPQTRVPGEIHTFAFVPMLGWHPTLLPDLRCLGPVTLFDYTAHGYRPEDFRYGRHGAAERRADMNQLAMESLRAAHKELAVDWVFVYASGLEIGRNTIRSISDDLGIPTVNMCLDDKQSWDGPVVGGQRLGQVDIAPLFDVSWTSAMTACEWYLVEGARPVYMPEGFDAELYRPLPVPRDIAVSFVGAAYGFRPSVVRHLRQAGVPVRAFGPGWGTTSVWKDDQVAVFNRSLVNLGMGGIGYCEALTNVKTRDFEIPGTGGGVYVTSYNADLSRHFEVGSEIACYRTRDEMVELVRYFLAHPSESWQMGQRARDRCLMEHRWLHRYQHLIEILGILPASDGSAAGDAPHN